MHDWLCNFQTDNFLCHFRNDRRSSLLYRHWGRGGGAPPLNLTPGSGPMRLFQVLEELLDASLLGWEFSWLFAKAFCKVCKTCESCDCAGVRIASSCAVVLRALLPLFRLLDVDSSWGSTIGSMVLTSDSACSLPSHRPYDLMEETGSRDEVHEDDVNDHEIEHGEWTSKRLLLFPCEPRDLPGSTLCYYT